MKNRGKVSLRATRWTLGAICLVYTVNMVIHATQLQASYRLIPGNDGDGVNDLYDAIDVQLWDLGVFSGMAILSVLLVCWLRRRTSN